MPKLYLAGPLGFSEIGRLGIQEITTKLKDTFVVVDPFEASPIESARIIEINEALSQNLCSFVDAKSELVELNHTIGKRNAELIKESSVILAILDGVDVDSGTAAEIGYAYGLGKKIYGYRGDFRLSADNLGSFVNLQVEYFIRASGGRIFTSISEFDQIEF